MAALAPRFLERFVLFAAVMLSAHCAPYFVSQQLRDSKPGNLYVYPPGARPWKPVRATHDGTCAGLPRAEKYFELRERKTLRGPELVIRDRGKLPPTRSEFDADIERLFPANCPSEPLKSKLWARMPRTFADDLLTRYGFDASRRHVDLQAGMRLRVEWAARIADVLEAAENSYVGTGTTWWTIGTRPDGVLAFEPAFGWGNAGKYTREPLDVIAGSVDLDSSGFARRFYRLVYPAEGFANTRPPNDNIHNRPVLLAADDEATLEDLAEQYEKGNCNRIANPNGGLCTPFAGRAVPVPEIQVELRGEHTWISLGTTLRQILERQGRDFRGRTRNLHLSRVYGSEWRSIVVDDASVLTHTNLLDLPLVKGDRLEW